MIFVDLPIAEVFASALDQEPEHERCFTDEGELGDVDRRIRDQHGAEPVEKVSDPATTSRMPKIFAI